MAEITTKDRERYAQARARGESRVADPSSVVDARYDSAADAIDLKFTDGGSMSIPRRTVPGQPGEAGSGQAPGRRTHRGGGA
jgi:hypothetical protein